MSTRSARSARAHRTKGTDAESASAVVTVDVNTDNLAANEELTFGFYSGDSRGRA